MIDRETKILHSLQNEIVQNYSDWGITNYMVIGRGIESIVYRADSTLFGPLAIKVPWQRLIANQNDRLDARDLLRQEATIASYLHTFDIPVPTVYKLHLNDEGIDFLASAFVEHDKSTPIGLEFGRLMKCIHERPVPDIQMVAQLGLGCDISIAERLARRARAVEQLAGIELPLLEFAGIQAMLDWPGTRQSILHMDARPANLFTREGMIVAITDWSNGLIGDPALELARIAEYGHLDEDFLAGYGKPNFFADIPRVVELIYRLDTAVMLAIVFLSQAPDRALADYQIKRSLELYEALSVLC
jgi:aminoglycoside phosphotransferase (APT) family kinase protein